MNNMKDLATFEIATCQKEEAEISFKEVTVVLVGAKINDRITLVSLGKNGNLSIKETSFSPDNNTIISLADFLIYDGDNLYNLINLSLVPLNQNIEPIYIPASMVQVLRNVACELSNEINRIQCPRYK